MADIWFGKFKGKHVAGVPDDYLKWLCTEFSVEPQQAGLSPADRKYQRDRNRDLVQIAEDELEERGIEL